MNENIPPSKEATQEAHSLSIELLKNIELQELPLTQICLKTVRLSRLLNDFEAQEIFSYECGGYPKTATGISKDIWNLLIQSNRVYPIKKKEGVKDIAYTDSIEQLEEVINSQKLAINAGGMVPIHLTKTQRTVSDFTKRLSSRRAFIYNYILTKSIEIQYSNIVSDAFTRLRSTTDELVGLYVPNSVKKFSAIYDNLESENSEDWANAVHSCRRILQDLADIVFPVSDPRIIKDGQKERTIKLGKDNYINRIMCFAEDNSKSSNFEKLVGSHLRFLGDRLDSIFSAAQKGSHSEIPTREEADRYVVFTYMIVGDILKLYAEIKLAKDK